jgi:hypothetical protein
MFKKLKDYIKEKKYNKELNQAISKYEFIKDFKQEYIYRLSNVQIKIIGNDFYHFLDLIKELSNELIININRSKYCNYNYIYIKDIYLIDNTIIKVEHHIYELYNIYVKLNKIYLQHKDNTDYIIGVSVLREIIKILENIMDKLKYSME